MFLDKYLCNCNMAAEIICKVLSFVCHVFVDDGKSFAEECRNASGHCHCNLATQIILQPNIYVIASDAFVPWKTDAHAKNNSLESFVYVIVVVTWQEKEIRIRKFFTFNLVVDNGTVSDSNRKKLLHDCFCGASQQGVITKGVFALGGFWNL